MLSFVWPSEQSKNYGDDVIGPLQIKIVGAALTRDTEMIGKMDPYLELSIGGVQVHKTKTLDEAGKNPQWNEECSFEVKDLNVEVQFKVSDEDYGSDDIVGEGKCTLADLCANGGMDGNFDILHKGSGAGTVHFTTSFVDFQAAKAEYAASEEAERLRLEEEEAAKAAAAAAEAAEAEAAAEAERLRIEAEEAAAAAEKERLEAEEAERQLKEAEAQAEKERLEAEEAERIAKEAAE